MSILIKKIIFQQDFIDYYHHHEFNLEVETPFPYVAGELQSLIPQDAKLDTEKTRGFPAPLFNKSGLTKLVNHVGSHGIYYIELRPNHKLSKIIIEPDEVVPDIYFGARNNLIYSFYNPTERENIIITAKLEEDKDNIFIKIKSDPTDPVYRQYFIRRALVKFDNSSVPDRKYPEYMTAANAADYLQVAVKTIRNWTSQDKIPACRISGVVRYKKSDLDEFIKADKKKHGRKKQNQ